MLTETAFLCPKVGSLVKTFKMMGLFAPAAADYGSIGLQAEAVRIGFLTGVTLILERVFVKFVAYPVVGIRIGNTARSRCIRG